MPYQLDAVLFQATATGTGSFTVSAALAGYRTPAAAGAVDGRTYRYRAQNATLTEYEVGTATASSTGTVFSRTVLFSSTGSAVNFTTAPIVAITITKADILQFEETMSLTAAQKAKARENIGITGPDVIIEEQQPSATGGGTATSGSWFTRVLNTLVRNVDTMASLSSNEFTLGAGTYSIHWSSPFAVVDRCQSRIYNVTDAAVVAYGTSGYSANTDVTSTETCGSTVVTISGSKAFRLEIQVGLTTANANALGVAAGFGNINVYSRVEITRLA